MLRKFMLTVIAVAVGVGASLALAASPATADESGSSAPAQADDPSPTPGVGSVETGSPLVEGSGPAGSQPAQGEVDPSSSTPVAPQDAPLPDRPTASKIGPAGAAALVAVYSTQILTPADAADVPSGSVAYSVQVATAGDYWLDLYCGGSFISDDYLVADSDGQQFTGSIGPVSGGDNCRLELYGISGTGADTTSITVEQPVPEVRKAAAGPETFYPRIRDGYRDRTDIGFTSRLDSDVTVKIISGSSGSTVRTFAWNGQSWGDYYERRWQTWNGRNKAGNLVPTGRYTAVITSTLASRSSTSRVPIWVASGHRNVRVTKRKDGWYDSIDRTRGNCFTSEGYDGNNLDCWGGRYAQATYRFALPRDAHNIDWGVRGYQGCCSQGRITKTGQRTSPSSFRIVVRVTNWRSFVVRNTWLSYTYRKAI